MDVGIASDVNSDANDEVEAFLEEKRTPLPLPINSRSANRHTDKPFSKPSLGYHLFSMLCV